MGKNKQVSGWDSQYMNNRTYLQYYNRLTELAVSMFEWKNLPSSVDPRFLELTLFSEGKVVFFEDKDLATSDSGDDKYFALQCEMSGNLDVYHIPMRRRAHGINGYSRALTAEDSVIIFNNYLHTNSMLDIEMYAKRLYQLERTIDVNVIQQKTPVVVLCDENQIGVMKNLYMKYEGNEPFIFGDKNLDLKGISVLNTNAPYVADKLNMLKVEMFNEALTYLGISNVNIQKKERLLSDEVTRNMGSIEAQKFTRLNARKEACDKINKMFGLHIEVEYRQDVRMLDEIDEDEEKGEEEIDG